MLPESTNHIIQTKRNTEWSQQKLKKKGHLAANKSNTCQICNSIAHCPEKNKPLQFRTGRTIKGIERCLKLEHLKVCLWKQQTKTDLFFSVYCENFLADSPVRKHLGTWSTYENAYFESIQSTHVDCVDRKRPIYRTGQHCLSTKPRYNDSQRMPRSLTNGALPTSHKHGSWFYKDAFSRKTIVLPGKPCATKLHVEKDFGNPRARYSNSNKTFLRKYIYMYLYVYKCTYMTMYVYLCICIDVNLCKYIYVNIFTYMYSVYIYI